MKPTDLAAIHTPDLVGRPICGTPDGRTSAAAMPTCPLCQKRPTLSGVKPDDLYNPAHPVGRIVMGATFGVPGFPPVPGITKKPGGGRA